MYIYKAGNQSVEVEIVRDDCIEKYILETYGSIRAFFKATGMKRKTVNLLLSDKSESDEKYRDSPN